MMSEYEAAKLRREMHGELDCGYWVLAKCAVGLVVLVTLAVVSPTLGVDGNGTPQTASASAAAR
jgi:hypothetical protein